MTSRTGTRERIIRKGAGLIHARGYTGTGLQDILTEAGVPKGSFYFYFKSKEDFGLELIDYFSGFIGGIFTKYLRDETVTPLRRIENLFEFYESFFSRSGCTLGCPIGNLSLELGDEGERFRERLGTAIDTLVGHVEICLEDARRAGEISGSLNTGDAARFIFHGIEGAILHMKVTKNTGPLHIFRQCIFDYLKAPRPKARKK